LISLLVDRSGWGERDTDVVLNVKVYASNRDRAVKDRSRACARSLLSLSTFGKRLLERREFEFARYLVLETAVRLTAGKLRCQYTGDRDHRRRLGAQTLKTRTWDESTIQNLRIVLEDGGSLSILGVNDHRLRLRSVVIWISKPFVR